MNTPQWTGGRSRRGWRGWLGSLSLVMAVGLVGPGGPAAQTPPAPRSRSVVDFDGDRKADIAVYRPATGEWFIWGTASLQQVQWGMVGDLAR